ncbi:DUF397 domain-containing protein [Streptomyces sp. 71268]|nr:DUF397 domain-containing protein [Streptomyces sp. 71268]WEV27929.1 DUF397 domain-containing protein [Streptomyces sp. 71268]
MTLTLDANAHDLTWVKSSYSNGQAGECVEWSPDAASSLGVVPVRDSKDPHGPTLAFTPSAWSTFVTGVKAGEFPAP